MVGSFNRRQNYFQTKLAIFENTSPVNPFQSLRCQGLYSSVKFSADPGMMIVYFSAYFRLPETFYLLIFLL